MSAENADDQTSVTIFGAMTPEYASPEQTKGETVTTATDVYSLGMILFKILTGDFPYNFKNKTNGSLLREITDAEPLRPSAAAASAFDNPNSKPQIPNPKSLAGDLDNIILKALSKEPARRYQSVEQFAADIWRFIDGLPVSARPATVGYRASKYFQRNKIPLIAAFLIFLSLVSGIIVALWQAREARAQANLAIESRRKSDDEREKAQKISRFMFKVFGYANPAWYAEGAKTGGNTRVIEAMEDLSDKIDVEFAGQADVQAELHHKFAESFGWTARYEKDPARKKYFEEKNSFHSRRALELRKQFYGEWHELVAKDLYFNFGRLGETNAEQAAILMKAIEMMRSTNPHNLNLPYMLQDYSARLMLPEFSEKHEAYRNAVTPPTDENKYRIAERYLREALPVLRQHYQENNRAIYANECRLAYALAKQDKWTEFDASFAVCKQSETQVINENGESPYGKFIESIEKISADKRK